jgi:hypothetical protein
LDDLIVESSSYVGGAGSGDGQGVYGFTDEELFEDAEEVEDFDLGDLLSPRANPSNSSSPAEDAAADAAAKNSSWDAGNMVVRCLDWIESRDALDGQVTEELTSAATPGVGATTIATASAASASASAADKAPTVPLDERFAMILGNEVMYEPAHARLVASVICHRLAPGGRALLCCAVRDQEVFEEFRRSCKLRGLRYRAVKVMPEEDRDSGGIRGRDKDYEGGYLLMAVDHQGSPAGDWHRDDFVLME